MPPCYNPPVESAESQALTVRRGGAFFLNLPRALLAVRGKDRVSFLHNLLSNDIKGLQSGQGKPACLLDRQGKILFSCTAHARSEEILLEMAPDFLPAAQTSLERYLISESAELSDATGRFRVVSLHGPAVPNLSLPPFSAPDSFLTRSKLLGMPGLDLWFEKETPETVFLKLRETCRSAGMTEGSEEIFDVLRIEAGVPWPGREITNEVILNELGREEFVSFTKGCYVGQEIVARIEHRAHPPRLLAGFLIEGTEVPPERSAVRMDSQEMGVITSACFSPSLGKPIALGFLKYGVEGEWFQLQTPSGPIPARKTTLPLVPSV